MKAYKSPKTGLITIWKDNLIQQYMGYSMRESMRKFKQKYTLRGRIEVVNYSPLPF